MMVEDEKKKQRKNLLLFSGVILFTLMLKQLMTKRVELSHRDKQWVNRSLSFCSDNRKSSIYHDSSFNDTNQRMIDEDQFQFCKVQNFVIMKHEEKAFQNEETARTYSINNKSYRRHHSHFCQNASDLLKAINWGTRSWELDSTNMSIQEKEASPSYFVPFGCDIPYMKQREFCAASNLFDHILIYGDSQSRHLHQATMMLYRNDVIKGSVLPARTELHIHHRCYCDAQYSPSTSCRPEDFGLFKEFKPYQIHACPHLPFDEQFNQRYEVIRQSKGLDFLNHVNCTQQRSKGILVYIQGGVHFKWRARQTFKNVWIKVLRYDSIRECARVQKLTLIWSGYTVQSPFMDEIFKHQSLEYGIQFEITMDHLIHRHRISLPILRWLNLTLGSPKADGIHFLTDVNLERAQHVMILAKMLRQENLHPDLGLLS
jgi:hypothetical protein